MPTNPSISNQKLMPQNQSTVRNISQGLKSNIHDNSKTIINSLAKLLITSSTSLPYYYHHNYKIVCLHHYINLLEFIQIITSTCQILKRCQSQICTKKDFDKNPSKSQFKHDSYCMQLKLLFAQNLLLPPLLNIFFSSLIRMQTLVTLASAENGKIHVQRCE